MRIPSGVTDQYIYFVAVDSTDLKTRETGLTTFTVYRSRNGAAAAAMTTPTVNETDTTNMPGVYELLLDEDMTIGAGNDSEEMVFHITQASMAPVTRTIELYRSKITAGNTLGVASDGDISGNVDGTVATVTTLTGHTAQTGDNYARLGAPAGASVSADIADVPTVAEFNARTLVAASYFDPAADTVTNVTNVANIGASGIDSGTMSANAILDIRDEITGGSYALDTDVNGAIRIVDGTGPRELNTLAGGIANIAAGAITSGSFVASSITAAALAADAATEIKDAVMAHVGGEPSQAAPPTAPTFEQMIEYLYFALTNEIQVDSTAGYKEYYNNAGTTMLYRKQVADDGTTYTENTAVTGV